MFYSRRIFIPHTSSSLKTGSGACGHPAVPFIWPGLSVHAHCTKGVTGSEERAGANWVEGENGSRNGDDNRDESGGEREPAVLRSVNRGGSEDERRWAMPTSNQHP